MGRLFFHIDVNSAFLSWEAVYRLNFQNAKLDLRTVPSAVGGDITKRHGIILAKSIPAKKYKIQTGEPVTDALKKCPELILVPPHYNLYKKSSEAFVNILKEYTPDIEQYSVDECFLDLSNTSLLYGDPVKLANEIRERIYRELGFTVNVGISTNKLLAKMASDFKKPNLVHTLFPEEIQDKMWPLPVNDLFLVGRATTRKLYTLGINTIGQLATTDLSILKSHLKKHGEIVWNYANGNDFGTALRDPEPNKGYGNSITLAADIYDKESAKLVLLSLAETVGARIRANNVKIKVVSVSIKNFQFNSLSHQMVLDNATNITNDIYKAAYKLFEQAWDNSPVRHLGIHTSRVCDNDEPRQLTLNFLEPIDYQKQEKMDKAIDAIRKRYGNESVKRACFAKNTKVRHMTGGIAEEKKAVDYSKVEIM